MEQELQKYEERAHAGEVDETQVKPMREIFKTSVIKIENQYYLVSGQNQIFLLFQEGDENAKYFAMQLTPEQIQDLPEDIVFLGTAEEFSTNVLEAFRCLVDILYNMNEMQDEKVIHFYKIKSCGKLFFCSVLELSCGNVP